MDHHRAVRQDYEQETVESAHRITDLNLPEIEADSKATDGEQYERKSNVGQAWGSIECIVGSKSGRIEHTEIAWGE